MRDSLASIKSSIKPLDNSLISNYIPAIPLSRGSERLQTITRSYMQNGWKVKDEATYNGKIIIRSVVTKEQVINNVKTVNIKTFDSATNKMNSIAEISDFNSNVKKIAVAHFDYDAVNNTTRQTNRVEAAQQIRPQKMTELENVNNKLIQKNHVSESKTSDQGFKLNSSPSDASTLVPAETRVKRELLDSKPIKHYEIIDGKRFLVTKDEFIAEGTQVQQARRDNSRFIAEITKNHQNGNIVSQTVKVREFDSASKKYFLTAQYKTEYAYDSENNTNTTRSNSQFYGRDGKVISLQDVSVTNGEIVYDTTMKFDSNGHAYISRFLNSDGKYENSRPNSTISDTSQLADSINSFPTKEINPASVETMISGTLGPRNLVPNMNYASRQ